MREKIVSILISNTDFSIKVDLLIDLFTLSAQLNELEMMNMANAFLTFSANRNDMIVNKDGLIGFVDDCKKMSTKAIWEEFKTYLKEEKNNA